MDFFQTLAECSVAFAGFAAIHAALSGRTTGRALHRSFTIVLTGASAFILSLLVLLLYQSGLSQVTQWRLASAGGLAATAYGGLLFYRSHLRLSALGQVAQAPIIFWMAALLILLPIPLMLLNLGGWVWTPGPVAYGVGLTAMLASGVLALLGSFWFPIRESIAELQGERAEDTGDARGG